MVLTCKENLSADSPVSANKPDVRRRARRTASVSSHGHSDEEDAETEAGQSEMTNDPNHLKRMRRYVCCIWIQKLDVKHRLFTFFFFDVNSGCTQTENQQGGQGGGSKNNWQILNLRLIL